MCVTLKYLPVSRDLKGVIGLEKRALRLVFSETAPLLHMGLSAIATRPYSPAIDATPFYT